MSDLKLFQFSGSAAKELPGTSMVVEVSLQRLIERNLETFLGVRFLASEHSTGKNHAGRIDTLGIDENGIPVIIEYKRAVNVNVINQGLYYLDWLMDHKGDVTLLVNAQLGAQAPEEIGWANSRLICIAGDFTKFDQYAVQQIGRNIELIRYQRFGEDLLLLELVNAASGQTETPGVAKPTKSAMKSTIKNAIKAGTTVEDALAKAGPGLAELFDNLRVTLLALGDDVQVKAQRLYFVFKRIKNFACVEVHPQANKLLVYVKVNPASLKLEEGFTRDVRKIGHFGTGDLEITLRSADDLARANHLLVTSYEAS
jgi:predicted transport protein